MGAGMTGCDSRGCERVGSRDARVLCMILTCPWAALLFFAALYSILDPPD